MRSYAVVRPVLFCAASCLIVSLSGPVILGQDVGADVGGGAGIFRPKNPETKKRTTKPMTPVVKSSSRSTGRKTVTPPANTEDRVEELLERGNQDRDARKFSDAEQDYQSALKLKPRDARAAYGLGNVFTDQQRWEDAETAYRNAVQWNPADVDALVALSVVLVQPRTGASNAKRFVDAENAARKAVTIQPNNALAWDRLGVALQSRELFNSETEHAYRRAVELAPEFAVAYAHLARVLRRLGRTDEATPLYEHAISLGKDAATLNVIAESLQAEQLWDKSEPVLRRALELDARNPTSLFLIGRMMAVRKRYAEAEGYLKTATEVSPGAFQPYNLLGSVYLALNRYQDAERTYDRAVEVASLGDKRQLAGVFGFEGVGDGYLHAKQNSDAIRVYQRGLELDPGNKQLEEKLSQAKSH